MNARMEFPHVAKRKQDISKLSLITLMHKVMFQYDTLSIFLNNENERRHSHIFYIYKVCNRL
jgi:hypothetical protein